MEQFDEGRKARIKEKNVYLLHLDTPRIIILSSVLIGIVVISFLFGMKINNDKDSSNDIFKQGNHILNLPLSEKEKNETIPVDPLLKTDENQLALNRPGDEHNPHNDIFPNFNNRKDNPVTEKEKLSTNDILTKENIKDIIPPVKEVNKKIHEKQKSRSLNNNSNKKRIKRKRGDRKQRTVEVVLRDKNKHLKKRNRRHYSVQVASLNSRSKALTVVNNLERMRYDAYIDRRSIKGRRYYRVKIGPIFTKRKAIRILVDIQDTQKYEDSFMVRE